MCRRDIYHIDGPHTGKYHNDETEGGMTIVPFNAVELYFRTATGNNWLDVVYVEDAFVKTVENNGTVLNLFKEDSIYEDDGTVFQNAYLFNEEEGYAVWVHVSGIGIAEDEAEKVAENLTVTVLDETVPYATEEEIALARKQNEAAENNYQEKPAIESGSIHNVGDILTAPDSATDLTNAEFTVTDIRVVDSMPADKYPEENYIVDYDEDIAPLLEQDGTMKAHKRYDTDAGESIDKDKTETVNSKFIIADVEITNTGDTAEEIQIAPALELLKETGSGTYETFWYTSASKAYSELARWEGTPIYQSVQQFTDNNKKHVYFAEIGEGETIKCTFAYVVDEDCVDNACLAFFKMGGSEINYPRVKVR